MNILILIIVGLAGVALGVYLARRRAVRERRDGARVPAQSRKKEENIARVAAETRQRGRITNDEVEELLNVSDASATNYLQELEDRGILRQVGTEGRHVYYEPRN